MPAPERYILADIFVRMGAAAFGPDWQPHAARLFEGQGVSEELIRQEWSRSGAPAWAVSELREILLQRQAEIVALLDFCESARIAEPRRH